MVGAKSTARAITPSVPNLMICLLSTATKTRARDQEQLAPVPRTPTQSQPDLNVDAQVSWVLLLAGFFDCQCLLFLLGRSLHDDWHFKSCRLNLPFIPGRKRHGNLDLAALCRCVGDS